MKIDDIPDERVRAMVATRGSCWVWTGATDRGYGQFVRRRGLPSQRKTYAHRYAWETFFGPVPKGHEVRHTCKRRECLHPMHLYTAKR